MPNISHLALVPPPHRSEDHHFRESMEALSRGELYVPRLPNSSKIWRVRRAELPMWTFAMSERALMTDCEDERWLLQQCVVAGLDALGVARAPMRAAYALQGRSRSWLRASRFQHPVPQARELLRVMWRAWQAAVALPLLWDDHEAGHPLVGWSEGETAEGDMAVLDQTVFASAHVMDASETLASAILGVMKPTDL